MSETLVSSLSKIRNLIKKLSLSLKVISEKMDIPYSTFKLKLYDEPYSRRFEFSNEELEKLKQVLKEFSDDIDNAIAV